MRNRSRMDCWLGLAAGAIGGALASWVMEEFQSAWNKVAEQMKELHESTTDTEQSPGAPEKPATVKAAAAISKEVFGHELAAEEENIAGSAVHYAMGTVSGAVYGAASEIVPAAAIGSGLFFGAAVWLIADEGLVPALGLSRASHEYPLGIHLYGLTAHLVYGLTADAARRLLRNTVLD